MRCGRFGLMLIAAIAMCRPGAQDPPAIMFHSDTHLVLVPFRVAQGKRLVTTLKAGDFVLLEDGKRRHFTIFDSAATQGRMPLEIILLFDTNKKIENFWDPQAVYKFVEHWDDAMSKALLDGNGAQIRISVYRCSGQKLYRMTNATTDPQEITGAIRRLLKTELMGTGKSSEAFTLSLPPRRRRIDYKDTFTGDFETSAFVSAGFRGWPMEAAIGALNGAASAQDKVARALVIFSEGIGATSTIPEDVASEALDLGIPIYPIATNSENHITQRWPRNYFRMHEFEALGDLTGGRSVEYTEIDTARLKDIVNDVKSDGLSQYVIGFAPVSAAGAAKSHKLEIKPATKGAGKLEGGKRTAAY